MARATPTEQQRCDYARINAWKTYVSCVHTVQAKIAKAVAFDAIAAFARCRHGYFKKWTAFQSNTSLAGSTCIGARFTPTDGGTTVTDNLSGLVWETKTNKDIKANLADVHDADNDYSLSTNPGTIYKENGTIFTDFLPTLNGGGGFAGSNGWRLPNVVELQSIVLDFRCKGIAGPNCTCGSYPCIDGAFGPTYPADYLSATTTIDSEGGAWDVSFSHGGANGTSWSTSLKVRAVRGGSW